MKFLKSYVDNRTILIYYREYERDTFFPGDHLVKRYLRPVVNTLRQRQTVSGFYVWYATLVRALRLEGYRVIVNDRSLALRYPHHPVGLMGYPIVLDGWNLPNPAILGPGLFDHPALRPDLLSDHRFQRYIVTCDWIKDMFEPVYGSKCVLWHGGIDMRMWPDTRTLPKRFDVLIYDKIRWNRDHYETSLFTPILRFLEARGLSYQVIRYTQYQQHEYRSLLSQARAMIFLCEHETQGMAYQEALASNVPVIAWDNGWWLDPNRPSYTPNPVPASSVPYFSRECGERFLDFAHFPDAFDIFWQNLLWYEPRRYAQRELSLAGSAQTYAAQYFALASKRSEQSDHVVISASPLHS